ncbi:glycosyltransferase [Microbacterium hydrocarbonoxydans]|uniref:glycosyltransferase n=1 Tax=Microbacterium hydrocarbonoxydans TaxID=273678 RepID=UPI00203D457E|nr:glycosyltransferase [Microbacterium hydrocarbonoxydans]MCM3779297.1 glycosyltransferase [Microbacterium hydrocarbonoxydans]
MPARVHAIIVARPGSSARAQLLHTLDALRSQTVTPAAITLVMCGDATTARESATVGELVEGVIEARTSTSFADAVELARPRIPEGSAVWLLAHDTAPHPRALERLVGTLERSPSAAIAAPKLVETDDDREIVSLGVSMTSLGRSVELAAGELDQGQHDGRDDVLGADVRGMLIRSQVRDALRPDRALGGADEGLDLGVRARLGGGRVVLAPAARVSVSPDGPAALPTGRGRRAFAQRLAQLHRRLAYAPVAAVPLHWLTLLPLALWRSITHLIGKRPEAVAPEWGAAATAMARVGAVSRSRRRIREFRTSTWSSIAPLRVSRADLRRRLDDGHGSERGVANELRFFSGGGAWAVLAALVVSVATFTSLLAWPVLGGGALLPLRTTLAALWADAAWGIRGLGVDVVGPADPFAGVIAVLGSLWPAGPSFALVLLWVLALPLAVLGAWFAATRVTDRAGLRILAGIVWALAPTFLTALVDGRPTGVLVHLLLPWLFHAAVVAHRSWGAAGAASLLFAGVAACAPSLVPALLLLWVIAVGVSLAGARVRGAIRLLWVLVPAAALFAPLVAWQLRHGTLVALLGDPGLIWAGPQVAAGQAGRLALASGFPSADLGGWANILGPGPAPWIGVLFAPLALLALIAAVSPRWRVGITLLVLAASGLATAFLAVGIAVSFAQGTPVAIWPGNGLSLAWLGVLGAALVTLDSAVSLPRLRIVGAAVVGLAVAASAVPALAAFHTGRSALTDGPASTLPAYVAAQAGEDSPVGTLVLTPRDEGGLAAEVAWGASETLGAQTTMLSTATEPLGRDITTLSVDLLSARDFDAAAQLGDLGISYVLLASVSDDQSDRARALGTAAITALDQRAGFVQAGTTDRGVLYRLEADAAPRATLSAGQEATARLVIAVQLVLLFAALLLSIPTRASRRAARATPRIVGLAAEERLVLPRHAEDLEDPELSEDDEPAEETDGGADAQPAEAEDAAEATADGEAEAEAEARADADAHASADTDVDPADPAGPSGPAADDDPRDDAATDQAPEHPSDLDPDPETDTDPEEGRR